MKASTVFPLGGFHERQRKQATGFFSDTNFCVDRFKAIAPILIQFEKEGVL
ncbi:MAG TPA: hypothetical protein VIW64_07170 [Pyrinomonadaceae bacterium]